MSLSRQPVPSTEVKGNRLPGKRRVALPAPGVDYQNQPQALEGLEKFCERKADKARSLTRGNKSPGAVSPEAEGNQGIGWFV